MTARQLTRYGLERRPGRDEVPCSECHGQGYLYSDNGPAPREFDCEDCGGEGVVQADEECCSYCKGPVADGCCPSCDVLAPVVRIAPGKVVA